MKKTSKKRLTLARDTVRALAVERLGDQIRGAAAPKESGNTPTVTPGPTFICSISCVRCNA